jgi:hypothetical protein
MHLVASFLAIVQPLRVVMTAPTFDSFVTLLTGWVFARRRTITGMIVAAGAVSTKHHSAYHRVFSAARWCLDELGLAIFLLVRPWIVGTRVLLALDDTLARKRGKKIYGVGMHYDPLISSRKKRLVNWGHSWVVLAVVVRFPFAPKRVFSLPILFRLYLNKDTAKKARRVYRPRAALAVDVLHVLCGRHPDLRFHALADSSYGGESVLKYLPRNCGLTSRLALNARLYAPPSARKPGTMGRPRVRGAKLPTPTQMLAGRAARKTLALYGRRDQVRLVEAVAHCHKVPGRALKVVATEALRGGRGRQAFYSTDPRQAGGTILREYTGRWSIEEANLGSKQHLGFEEPPGWSPRAVLRTAPIAMLLYSLVVVWFAGAGVATYRAPDAPWYLTKRQPSFADMLATLKRESLREGLFVHLPSRRLRKKVHDILVCAAQIAA